MDILVYFYLGASQVCTCLDERRVSETDCQTYEIIETYKESKKIHDLSICLTLHLSSLQLSEIRKGNLNQTVIGKKVIDNKEELEAGAEDEDVDNVGDSEGDEFEQETG